jgi:hypothetical protein
MSAEPKVYHAIRTVKVAIAPNARDQYMDQVKMFAQAFGFTMQFSQTSPYPDDIVAAMERGDISITGVMASRFEGPDLAYEIFLYSKRNPPAPAASFDPLVEGLKLYLSKIDGAVVTETK